MNLSTWFSCLWGGAVVLVVLHSFTVAQLPTGHLREVVVPLPSDGLEIEQWQPRHVHLAYGQNTSSVVVTWSTLTPTAESIVEWGTDLFDLNYRSSGKATVFVDGGSLASTQYIHRVHLEGLQPSTTYYYHVGSSEGWSAVFGFKTVAGGTRGWPLRLAVYGDLGVTNAQSLTRLQQEAHEDMYDAVLHVGDMAYDMNSENGSVGDAFMDQIESIAAYLPYMTCPGNHESAYNFSQYRNRFSMPGYEDTESIFYSFDIGPVHFVAVSTEVYYYGTLREINRQYQWLVRDLQAATSPAARAERPWVVVFGHRPMYCSTRDGDDCTHYNCRTRVGLPLVHWYGLEPLLYKYGVDLAIWAHEHAYERLFPIYNYTVLPGPQQPYVNPRGPVHLTTGSAGCDEKLDDFTLVQPEWSAKRINQYGYTRLTVHNATHLYWEQVAGNQEGQLLDQVWLVKEQHGSYLDSP